MRDFAPLNLVHAELVHVQSALERHHHLEEPARRAARMEAIEVLQ